MVKIPEEYDPTLMAMMKVMEGENEQREQRDYLGASAIGDECPRKVWYRYNNYNAEPFSARTLMNFADGHASEEITAQRLRMVEGITLVTHGEDGNQIGFSDFDGKFKGHCDGMILGLLQAPKTWHVWEHKCCNDKNFNSFKKIKQKLGDKSTLKEWSKTYYAQAQLYMHYMKVNRHYMTVSLAGSRDYVSCRTEYHPDVAEFYIDRAKKIINATEAPPRINDKPDFYLCRWCEFSEICHNEDTERLPRERNKSPF